MKTIIKVKIKSMNANPIASPTGIQIGEVTHHQDQSITPVNFHFNIIYFDLYTQI